MPKILISREDKFMHRNEKQKNRNGICRFRFVGKYRYRRRFSWNSKNLLFLSFFIPTSQRYKDTDSRIPQKVWLISQMFLI